MRHEAIDAWERGTDGALVRYRCFRVLPDGGYGVPSADHYRPGMSAAEAEALDRSFRELLAEGGPEDRGGVSPTLAAAVEQFRRRFSS